MISNKKYQLKITDFLNVVCLFFFLATIGKAQTLVSPDTTGFRFWYSSFDARSMALANATVADRMNTSSLYSNPATIIFNSGMPRFAIHSLYNSKQDILVENFTAFFSQTRNSRLILGGTILHNGFAGLNTVTTRYAFNQYELDIAFSTLLTSSLSMGIKWNSVFGSTATDTEWANNARLGFLYAPSKMVSYGVVYKGTGYQNHWLGSGLSYYQTSTGEETQIRVEKIPHRLEVGTTLKFPSLEKYPDFVLSFSNEKLFGEPGLIYRAGLEIYLKNLITLRGGYFHSPIVQGPRFGLGLLFDPVTLNYSYAKNSIDRTGRSHQLTITVRI